jgi:hypothetical protein
MKEITLETKVSELLNDYKGMKEILIDINPKFKKLNNPVLRRTLAKIAGVKQAAVVGGMDPIDLLNQLRVAVGQTPVEKQGLGETKSKEAEVPAWIEQTPKATLDANLLLDEEENPLVVARKLLRGFKEGDVLTICADFQPEPLIDEFEKAGYSVFCQKMDEDRFMTYVKR